MWNKLVIQHLVYYDRGDKDDEQIHIKFLLNSPGGDRPTLDHPPTVQLRSEIQHMLDELNTCGWKLISKIDPEHNDIFSNKESASTDNLLPYIRALVQGDVDLPIIGKRKRDIPPENIIQIQFGTILGTSCFTQVQISASRNSLE